MSINLSDLTSPNNQDVLAEITSAADFLDPIGKLENLSRSPNKGGPALQTTALNQPRALPLIDGDGYLYLPTVSGNYASIPDEAALDITGDIALECDFIVPEFPLSGSRTLFAKYNTSTNVRSYTLFLDSSGHVYITLSQDGTFNPAFQKSKNFSSVLSGKTRATVKVTWRQSDGRTQFFIKESDGSFTQVSDDVTLAATSIYNSNLELEIGTRNSGQSNFDSSLGVVGARIYASVDGTDKRLDVDFTATNVRHGATKFKCATGQVVTINQSGNDPATIIKRSVLRFSSATSGLKGLFANQIDGGYMFAAFSVLGTGVASGESSGRVFSINKTGGEDFGNGGAVFSAQVGTSLNLRTISGTTIAQHNGLYDDTNGDILHSSKLLNNQQLSKVNNADAKLTTNTTTIEGDEFNIGVNEDGVRVNGENAAIDLEFLALFSADSVPDEATASKIRNYINNRNNVFSLVDNSYYFFDPQKADFTGNFTDANTLDGYITGSDLGDTDVRTDLTLVQATLNDQPSTDGYTITFNDNAEHLEFENSASQNLSGWQVVGTSLGTFAYRVQGAVTELNLLGNLGSTSHRKAGQSYGMMLLPESATGADIEAARSLLIDRGAADGVSGTTLERYFSGRQDIVNFNHIETSNVTEMWAAFLGCNNIVSYPLIDTSSVTSMGFAFQSNNSLESFPAIQAPLCASFQNTWQGTTALQSFSAGAKLGTAANNVNFQSAWQSSGLTSFPALDLSNGNIFANAFKLSQLTSFPEDILLGTNSTAVRFDACWMNCGGLTSFPNIDLSEGRTFNGAWWYNTSLEHFPALFTNWNPSTVTSSVFHAAWTGCSSLSSTSVENILTSIDSSGVFGTYTGLVTGTALPDAGIDIDYNVATGSLSAATNAAIDSLSGKGWEVYINGVLVIPNILDLAPAAAYSLRSFDADADPNVVNVRRSSDGATSDFTASEVSDGTLVAFVGAGNDGHVTTWYDQGGTNHATQTVASSQPKLVDAGTLVTEGGQAALDFDGVNNYLELANGSISLPCSTFVTQKLDSVIDSAYTFGIQQSGNNGGYLLRTNGYFVIDAASPFPSITLSGASDTDEHLIYVSAINGGKISGAVDGGTLEQSTDDITGWTSAAYATTIGRRPDQASLHLNGKLKELIHFNTDQSANRTGIENNINDHFDIYS